MRRPGMQRGFRTIPLATVWRKESLTMLTSSEMSMAQRGAAGGRADGKEDLSRLASGSSWDVGVGTVEELGQWQVSGCTAGWGRGCYLGQRA